MPGPGPGPSHGLTAADIPFLLEQLEHQGKSLAAAESTITRLEKNIHVSGKKKNSLTNVMSEEDKDEMDLEIETMMDRMAMTEEGLSFFFREYARLKRLLNKHKVVDTEDALIRASESGKLHIVALLLEADADANVRDQSQGTALIAASYSGHKEVVAELLKYKVDTDLQDDGGHTALFFACDKGHMDICTLLVEAGASLNDQDCRGNTGLTMAAYIGHIDVCHLLVGGGVDVNIKNDDGRTPLMMSCYPPEVETRYLNAKSDICELLIGAGADVNATNSSKNTALHIASKYGHIDQCEMLLKAGADATIRNRDGKSAVDVAGDIEVRGILMRRQGQGLRVDTDSPNNYPPLPTNVNTISPTQLDANVTSKANKEKTYARSSSMKVIRSNMKSVFNLGKKDKEQENEDVEVNDVQHLYGTSDRVSDRQHRVQSVTGERQRYAFVHENALAKRATGAVVTSAEKKKDKLKLDKLSKISSNQNPPQMSVGQQNALAFGNIMNRNSLDGRHSSGSIDTTGGRDSLSEARERRRRMSSGATGDMARKLEEMRRRSSAKNNDPHHDHNEPEGFLTSVNI